MRCKSPRYFPKSNIVVRCGHCRACRAMRSNEWALRMSLEQESYKDNSVFLTLTYDDEHLPENKSLDKSVLQKFIKRLRYYASLTGRKLKHFSCGEYGKEHLRPHYHLIVFGLANTDEDVAMIHKAWTYGFIYVGTVTYKSCRYVTKYLFKQDSAEFEKAGLQPPFRLLSNGIGRDYLFSDIGRIARRKYIVFGDNARKYPLPRYFKTKIVESLKDWCFSAARLFGASSKEFKSAVKRLESFQDYFVQQKIMRDEDDFDEFVSKNLGQQFDLENRCSDKSWLVSNYFGGSTDLSLSALALDSHLRRLYYRYCQSSYDLWDRTMEQREKEYKSKKQWRARAIKNGQGVYKNVFV